MIKIPKLENGLLRTSKIILLFLGMIVAAFGLFGIVMEMWHVFEGDHEVRWTIIGMATAMLLGGAGLVQTMSVVDAFGLVRDFIPLIRSQQPGGRRVTDPPPAEQPVITKVTIETEEPDV